MANYLKSSLLLLLATGIASAYPTSGTVDVTGASDFVGQYTIAQYAHPNLTVTGYGGGYGGQISSPGLPTYTQMLFCDDFANDVNIPSGNVSVNITAITGPQYDATQFQNDTRFGAVADNGWRNISTYLPTGQTLTSGATNTINSATALQRYEMAAYLISNYDFFNTCCSGPGNNNNPPGTNNYYGWNGSKNTDLTDSGIQSAIWAMMDPMSDVYTPPNSANQDGNIATWLTCAANWLNNDIAHACNASDQGINTSAAQALLSSVRIVSDAKIARAPGALRTQVGIQELMTFTPAPEPGFYGVLAIGLAGLFWFARRNRQAARATTTVTEPRA